MKRILLGTLFTVVSLNAMAEAPGGPNCGWGNMLFEGQRGTPAHFLASTTIKLDLPAPSPGAGFIFWTCPFLGSLFIPT